MCHAFVLNQFMLDKKGTSVGLITYEGAYPSIYRLYTQLFPEKRGAITLERFRMLLKDPNVTFVGAFHDDMLIGVATLIRFQSLYRTAVLIEEFVVDEVFRGIGIGKKMCAFIIDHVRTHTDATRIESTARTKAMIKVYKELGFIDRNNRAMLYLVER